MRNALIAVVALMAQTPLAAAQPAAARPDPANPQASAPVFQYESAFTNFRGFREAPLAPWRDVNEDVARAGGHVGIFRGAGTPSRAPTPATSGPAPKPARKQ